MQVEQFQVTYCTNVHPGQTLPELCAVLEHHVPAVRDKLGAKIFGLGLRLGHPVVRSLTENPTICRCSNSGVSRKIRCFYSQWLSYGNFDSGVIKADVYEPDWTAEVV